MRILLFMLLSIFGSAACTYGATTDFIITVNTANTGSSNGTSFTIPTAGIGYNYSVDWKSDGTQTSTGLTGSVTHDFTTAGTYTITISGTFPRIFFNSSGDRLKITSVVQWGSAINWISFVNAFYGCTNMTITATDVPVLTGVTSFNYAFANCSSITTGNLGSWNVQTITDMSYMFSGCSKFNDNIGNWNTSVVTTMSAMFDGNSAFNQNISTTNTNSWNTAAVTDMSYMFNNAVTFNQNIGNWNTAKVTDMSALFSGCTVFNNLGSSSIGSWNTAMVIKMQSMFYLARAFNQNVSTTNTNSWNTAAVTNMSNMFLYASAFNQNIGNWNTAKATNMSYMFYFASAFNQDISSWNTAAVSDMSGMFYNANNFNQNIGNWNTAKVTNMSYMFYNASAFNQDISSWNTAAVTNMSNMFYNANNFNQNIGNWNTAAVTDMSYMFYYASAFNQNIGNWNTATVINMSNMFLYASAFNQNIGNWNTVKVINMSGMFYYASAFNQNISSWNTVAVTTMSYMFGHASAFNQNIGNWSLVNGLNMSFMLDNSGMNVANYDNTLIGWQASPHPTGISLGAIGLHYCASSVKRAALINNSWSFTDTYLYATAVPTLVAANTLVATAVGTCTNATGYQQFMDKLNAPTANYMAINPNANTGYSFSVTAANNSPTVNNQHLVSGQNTTALANRMYTVVDAGTNNYPTGMTVRIYYNPADTAAAVAALAPSSSPVTSQWFKMSGSSHSANVTSILANQNASGINGATFLVPSATGIEGGINYVEFAGITSFSTFGYLAAKTNGTLLPVTLASFNGMANGCTANLSWQSATESNSSYYGIEESSDGSSFAQVARVNSGNSASGAAYTHACTLQGGTNYYRLKMVDLDGRFSYSPTVAIVGTGTCGTGIKATASPNPTSDMVNIAGLSIGSTAILYDMNGKEIYTLHATATTATINMQPFTNGIYLLHIQKADGTVEALKIVRQ